MGGGCWVLGSGNEVGEVGLDWVGGVKGGSNGAPPVSSSAAVNDSRESRL